jgi:hypothetical protein
MLAGYRCAQNLPADKSAANVAHRPLDGGRLTVPKGTVPLYLMTLGSCFGGVALEHSWSASSPVEHATIVRISAAMAGLASTCQLSYSPSNVVPINWREIAISLFIRSGSPPGPSPGTKFRHRPTTIFSVGPIAELPKMKELRRIIKPAVNCCDANEYKITGQKSS